MAATYESILQSLKQKKYQPVYFLTGEEPYFIDKITSYIAENVLPESERSFNQMVFYGKDSDVSSILNAAQRYPMMSDYQVVIVKEAQDLKKIEEMQPYLEKPVPSTILVLVYKHKTLDKRTKFYKVVQDKAVLLEAKKLKENLIPDWITEKLKEKNIGIQQKAAFLLSEYIGNHLENLNNAIEKLALAAAEKGVVEVDDIENSIGVSKEYNIFELQDALGKRDVVKSTKILNYLKNNPKTSPIQAVVATLFGYFSKICIMERSGNPKEMAGKIKLPPFLIQGYIQAAGMYKGKSAAVIELLLEYDLRSKGVNDTGTPQGELMEEMVYRILYV
jgi:DNA polymerase III subunit delta